MMRTGSGGTNTTSKRVIAKKEPSLKFCVLNLAVQAKDELRSVPRAVALVGGNVVTLGRYDERIDSRSHRGPRGDRSIDVEDDEDDIVVIVGRMKKRKPR